MLVSIHAAGAELSQAADAANSVHNAPVAVSEGGPAGFTLLGASTTGIAFSNSIPVEKYTTNQIFLNGSGVAAGDIDGDGRCDLFFAGLGGRSTLYRNLGGWRFQDITGEAGVSCPTLDATGAVFADIDGDGDLDLLVNSVGSGTIVFINDGRGRFTPRQVLNAETAGMSMALADIDGDGSLALYIANYRPNTLRDQPGTNLRFNRVNGQPVLASVNGRPASAGDVAGRFTLKPGGGIVENGDADGLYRNNGAGQFTRVPFTGGSFLDEDGKPLSAEPRDWGLSVMVRDLNGDGLPDIYVCNDFDSIDRIWMNRGHGVFQAAPRLAFRNTSKFSMGVDVADINRDGFDDVFVLDMLSRRHVVRMTRMDKAMEVTPLGIINNRPQMARNTLHLARGDGTFSEIAYYAGLEASDWSWTPIFLDVDLDGYEDLLVTSGHGRDDMDLDTGLRLEAIRRGGKLPAADYLALRQQTPPLPSPKLAFRNGGNLRFEEVGKQWGFNDEGISHGMCLADLDNDGDLDVIVNNLNGPAGIYRNNTSAPRIAVRLKGLPPNTQGIGAKIRVLGGAVPMQSQEVICGGRYLSGDDPMRVFAAGSLTNRMRIEIDWRSGKRSVVEGAQANRVYEIAESGADQKVKLPPPSPAAMFEDVSARLGHVHHEDPFDDFERQPLLPKKLSQLGPGVAWMDLDGDGWEDLVIGSGKGGPMAGYRNNGQGGFTRMEGGGFIAMAARDQTALAGLIKADGKTQILAGLASYEDGLEAAACVAQYDMTNPSGETVVPGYRSSVGPLALGDPKGDGNLVLFAGGRMIPGRYPESSSSLLLTRRSNQWVLDEAGGQVLKGIGLVSGAVWTDLDGDGYAELVLACEWGPVRVFKNNGSQWRETTREWKLDQYTGWWNGVSAGDFDGDGRMDLAVSNWGLNTKYRANSQHPQRLYYGNFAGQGQVETVEADYDEGLNQWVPERDLNAMSGILPWAREKYPRHRDYARASVEELLGDKLEEAKIAEATWLETTVFLNRGDHFELGKLPAEAQFSPAFGVNVADFDGDGHEDLFLSQNFFAVPSATSRSDAGRGLLLKGDGRGTFTAVKGQESGIAAYGEQRGSAVCDYDGDGRVDLALTQNGAETLLYRNRTARPGLRVKLSGPPGNFAGIGAVMRLSFGNGEWGPAREIHGGGGYWSQDSVVQVLATPKAPRLIQIRWPGGQTTSTDLPPDAIEINAPYGEKLK